MLKKKKKWTLLTRGAIVEQIVVNEVFSTTQGDADSKIDVLDNVVVYVGVKGFHDRYAAVLDIVDIVSFLFFGDAQEWKKGEKKKKEGKKGEKMSDASFLLHLAEVHKSSQV